MIHAAAELLRRGGLVVFPTETVYGLGADALRLASVNRVFEAKGRPADNPLIVHVASLDQVLDSVMYIPSMAQPLIEKFWPGPLTLVMKAAEIIPENVTAGLDTVAIRMPDHPVALELIRALGSGIVGPSANRSGRPSPTTAQHVLADLDGRVEMILDAGHTDIGVESTVLDVTGDRPVVLRLGGLSLERITAVVGHVERPHTDEELRRSPGTRHRHYAPRARVILIPSGDAEALKAAMADASAAGQLAACLVKSISLPATPAVRFRRLSEDIHQFAHELFAALRELDDLQVDRIIVESVPEDGLGAAVMDRLRRASIG